MHTELTESSALPQHRDPGALRRAVACALTLLDELERNLARSPADPAGRDVLVRQAAEELTRIATLLAPRSDSAVPQATE